MLKWRIYYADETTFSNEDGTLKEAPGFGVMGVCQPQYDVGLETLHTYDFYLHLMSEDHWVGITGHDALVDQMVAEVQDIDAVLSGRMTTRDQYQKIMRLALHDPDFPRKSGTHAGEKPQGTSD